MPSAGEHPLEQVGAFGGTDAVRFGEGDERGDPVAGDRLWHGVIGGERGGLVDRPQRQPVHGQDDPTVVVTEGQVDTEEIAAR